MSTLNIQGILTVILLAGLAFFEVAPVESARAQVSVSNKDIGVQFDVSEERGIALSGIEDRVTGREYVRRSTFFFEYAVDLGQPYRSDDDLVVKSSTSSPRRATFTADSAHVPLEFKIAATADPVDPVVILRMSVQNLGETTASLRMVVPKIRGLLKPGNPDGWMGTIPQEIGSVVTLGPQPIGMPFNLPLGLPPIFDPGLPTAMNTMELASLFDPRGTGGLFFADLDGDPDSPTPQIQFTLSSDELAGFWIADLAPGERRILPRVAIGVHHDGDWHQAVDFYLRRRPAPASTDVPGWFREAGAIYSFSGGGAGGIYLGLPIGNLVDGAVWTTFETFDSHFTDAISFTRGGLAPAGAPLAALMRNVSQEDVFVVGGDGEIETTFEVNDGAWQDSIPLTDRNFASPGGLLAATKRDEFQEDLFVVGSDGAVYTLYEYADSPWFPPIPLTPPGFAPPGAALAAVLRDPIQEDLFVVGNDGTIWTLFVRWDGQRWGGWNPPIPLSPPRVAPPGAPLAAVPFGNDSSEDLYVVGSDGSLLWLVELRGGGWSAPVPVIAPGTCVPGAGVAAAARNVHQEDAFVTDRAGNILTVWTDPPRARYGPVAVAEPGFAVPGADLAAAVRNPTQEDLFVVNTYGSIVTLFEKDDSPWIYKGLDPLTIGGFAPARSGIAAVPRNDHQTDAFAVGQGRIRSFRELHKLLEEARGFGTNVVYLWDYWEGSSLLPQLPYFNKGDYKPRADLGGEAALIEGIQSVRNDNGHVILYVEPFIVSKYSELGQTMGDDLAGRDVTGHLWSHYGADYYVMIAPYPAWQDRVVDIASRLVNQYHADGLLLDSWGWQLNWPTLTKAGHLYSAQDWTRGVLDLVRRVKAAIPADAVVLGETTSGPMSRVWDGGFSADFTSAWWFNKIPWSDQMNQGRIIASPVRYAAPKMNWFSNGLNLRELHEVYASGHNLALCSNWPGSFMYDNALHIRGLVRLRRIHSNALVYGSQEYQPATSVPEVAAYVYRGSKEVVLTVVNTDPAHDFSGDLQLRQADSNSRWLDLLHGGQYTATGTRLNLDVPADEHENLRVLLKLKS